MLKSLLFGSVLALCLSTANGAEYTCGSVTTREEDNMAVAIKLDTTNSMVYITMTGPDGQWFGAGFGSTTMSGTYAIIVEGDGTVSERSLDSGSTMLGGQSAIDDTLLTESVTEVSNAVYNGVRRVVLSRAFAGTSGDYYTFVGTSSSLDIIWATTSGQSTFQGHDSNGPSSISFMSGLDETSDYCDLTVYTCGSVTTYEDEDMAVALRIDESNSMLYIIMTGPDDQWFGTGFGSTSMPDTYAIIVDGNGDITERSLLAGSSMFMDQNATDSTILTETVTEVSDETSAGVRKVVLSRDLAGADSDYYTFDASASELDLIWATTEGSIEFTAHSAKDPSSIASFVTGLDASSDYCDLELPEEVSSTAAGDSGYTCGSVTTSEDDNMAVALRIDESNSMIYIIMTGPDDQWFGAGFGSSSMSGTYAIIVDGNGDVTEHNLDSGSTMLGGQSAIDATLLTATVTEVSDETSEGVRKVVLSRSIAGDSDDYYTFDASASSLALIWGTTEGSVTFTAHTGNGPTSISSFTSGLTANDDSCDLDLPGDDEEVEDAANMAQIKIFTLFMASVVACLFA